MSTTMEWDWLSDNDATTRDIWHVQRVDIADAITYALDQSRGLYVFRGSAGISGRIRVPGFSPSLFQDNQLYTRTTDGLWRIRWKAWLKPRLFRQIHESVFVNLRKQPALVVDALEWKWYQFAFSDGHVERVPISRSCYSCIREDYRRPVTSITRSRDRGRSSTTPSKTTESDRVSPESDVRLDEQAEPCVQGARAGHSSNPHSS